MPPRKRSTSSAGGKSSATRSSRSTTKTTTTRKTSATSRARKPTGKTPPADPPPKAPPPVEVDTFGRFSEATPASTADLAGYYGRLITVSRIRVELLGNLLAEQYRDHKLNALRRITYTATEDGGAEPSGEVPTALVRLEMEERRTLERLLVKAAELGLKLRELDEQARAENAAMTIGVLRAFVDLAGLDQQDPDVRRMMQRAVLAVKQPTRQIASRR